MKKRIKTNYINYLFLLVLCLSASLIVRGQQNAPKTSIGNLKDILPGQTITVPLSVTGFTNIGSFYLYVEYDSASLVLDSLSLNSDLTGIYDMNDIELDGSIHRIILSYSGGINGISLPDSSSIVDLSFTFMAGPAEIILNTTRDNYCFYTDPQANRLNDQPKTEYYKNGTIEASALVPSTPTVDTVIQPNSQVADGSVVLSGLPEGNWIINPGEIAGTGSSYTVSGLTPGTYQFTVTNANNYTSGTVEVVIEEFNVTALNNILMNDESKKGLSFGNFPNPFIGHTTFKYELPENGQVMIKVYNSLGQQVALLVDAYQVAGQHSIKGNLHRLKNGIYIAFITFEGESEKKTDTVKLKVLE